MSKKIFHWWLYVYICAFSPLIEHLTSDLTLQWIICWLTEVKLPEVGPVLQVRHTAEHPHRRVVEHRRVPVQGNSFSAWSKNLTWLGGTFRLIIRNIFDPIYACWQWDEPNLCTLPHVNSNCLLNLMYGAKTKNVLYKKTACHKLNKPHRCLRPNVWIGSRFPSVLVVHNL